MLMYPLHPKFQNNRHCTKRPSHITNESQICIIICNWSMYPIINVYFNFWYVLSKCLAHLTVCDVCFISQGVLLCPQTLSQARRTRLRRAFTEATGDTVSYVKTVDIYKQYSSKQSNIKQYKKSTKSNRTPSKNPPQQPPASHPQTVLFERSTQNVRHAKPFTQPPPFTSCWKKYVYESPLCVVLDLYGVSKALSSLVCALFQCCLLFFFS